MEKITEITEITETARRPSGLDFLMKKSATDDWKFVKIL